MADRYLVMGQVFIANGTGVITEVGRHVADKADVHVTTEGTFTFTMASGMSCVVSSGAGCTVAGSPQTLAAGANTVTVTGTGVIAIDVTIGTAANWNTVNSWSATSGGVSGASVPTSADNVFFDANSFTAGSQVLTINATANCLSMDWTGATNSPNLAGTSFYLWVYGNFTTIAAMTWSHSSFISLAATSGTQTVTTNGLAFNAILLCNGAGGTVSLADALTCNRFYSYAGTLLTNNNNITTTSTTAGFYAATTADKVWTFGSSTITCYGWTIEAETVGHVTLTANTSTIIVLGTGGFQGSTPTGSYGTINLNGTAHTVSGAFTCATFTRTGTAAANTLTLASSFTVTGACTIVGNAAGNRLTISSSVAGTARVITCLSFVGNHSDYSADIAIVITNAGAVGTTFAGNGQTYPKVTIAGAGDYVTTISGNNTFNIFTVDRSQAAKTITGTAGSTQTANEWIMRESGTTVITLNSTGAVWTMALANGGRFFANYLSVTSVTASPAHSFFTQVGSTDGGDTVGWEFRRPLKRNADWFVVFGLEDE